MSSLAGERISGDKLITPSSLPQVKHFAIGISASFLSTCVDELSGSTLFARGAGRGRPDHLPSHPPHFARKDAVQLAHVPPTDAAARHALEQTGEHFSAAPALPGPLPVGAGVRASVLPEAGRGRPRLRPRQ